MARSEAKRQKKLMKKKRKDKLRKQKQLKSSLKSHFSVKRVIYNARNYPIHECLISQSWKETGVAQILLSRRQPDGKILFGVYLVDIFCLGLKNTFCNAGVPFSNYESELKWRILKMDNLIECPIPLAHRIIYGAIEYASKLGFKPHKDFEISKYILEEEDKIEEKVEVEFGRDGKPFFVAGPEDNAELIIKQLSAKLGPGNFDYLITVEE